MKRTWVEKQMIMNSTEKNYFRWMKSLFHCQLLSHQRLIILFYQLDKINSIFIIIINRYFSNYKMDENCSQYNIKQIAQADPQKILQILLQKQQIIQSLSHQITKYKTEQVKLKKNLKQLQQKIQKLSPSNNTTSNFMLPSQFKVLFQQFMSNKISSVFGQLIQSPLIYKRLVSCTFSEVYNNLKMKIKQRLKNILQIFSLSIQYQEQLFQYLLPFLQNHYQQFILDKSAQIRFNSEQQNIKHLQQSEDFRQFIKQLQNICIYMLLQQKSWQFVFSQSEILKFQKKQHTCIDGWLKQGQSAIIILKGLKKQSHFHPNLKNFVIPIKEESINLDEKQKANNLKICHQIVPFIQIIDKNKQKQILKDKFQGKKNSIHTLSNNNFIQDKFDQFMKNDILGQINYGNLININKNKSFQNQQRSQSYAFQNKKDKGVTFQKKKKAQIKTEKSQHITFECKQQQTFQLHEMSQDIKEFQVDKENHNSNKKKIRSKQNKDKMGFIKKKKDRNASLIQQTNKKNKELKNIFIQQSYQQIACFPCKNSKKYEDLPFNRQQKKNRKNSKLNAKTSRKCSVGKIVNQSNQLFPSQKIISSQVSTMLLKQSLTKNQNSKQRVYSQAINKKLCEKLDKMIEKQKNSKKVQKDLQQNLKTKQKKQQYPIKQDRIMKLRQEKPIRSGIFTGKLRQKYLN